MSDLPPPSQSPDVQEALSFKHSNKVVQVLRLRSGRYAVFEAYKLKSIVENPQEVIDIINHSIYNVKPVEQRVYAKPTKHSGKPKLTLEELGL